jgi:putative restriction endonuclease
MPQFWWVNHKQTARQEIEGQYLWSPKTRNDGARNTFYDNMRRATPGDFVLSYADQQIKYVGRVTEFAFTAPKPTEFGATGANWGNIGWLLPVYWVRLDPSVRPKALIETLGPLLPTRYSPIDPVSGSGYQGVYLAAIPTAVFDTVTAVTNFDRARLAYGGANGLTFEVVTELLNDIVERSIADDVDIDDTLRSSLIQARRGQGKFRQNVEMIEPACRLTGITNPSLLTASHIKPWRLCDTAHERLDGMNGLMLSPDADHLFDRGFISFEDNGEVLVSPRLDRDDLRRLGFEQLTIERFGFSEAPAVWRTGDFIPSKRGYMDYHRKEVFVS